MAEAKDSMVTIPRDVVVGALTKARVVYVRNCPIPDAGPDWECWAEFEALADALSEADGRTDA